MVGVEVPGFEMTRVYAGLSPVLGGAPTRLRATAWRDRVHTLEITFPSGCSTACAGQLEATLVDWLGLPREVEQGRSRLLTLDVDTVRVRFEIYPAREDLTRLLLSCGPLADRAASRPSRLPAVGERAVLDDHPVCRALAP